ncbi:pilus assembly protein TadG-related protein [Melittangium boletus]|uniref:Putative Flp pilus-assembly TadG-like N-terminal domain-containing protein n=1 Tax=Melittangium boletus DSM 14713 TaxID=1294270 RepID=A0A250ILK9_9BACT|nr:pilus assembly protein TadG-related protein [Melittangium boletus]ATB32158.1 hypothetical protein MEBOL_005634 [Melittangium boletus DSM 14713]
MNRRPRGQALVLLALTMLLLVLMVCVTLSFSMRVREKMEAQSLADLAAYSSAVATARTFNSIALLRRAETGHMVAMTATMSLVSWTSMMRANLNAARVATQGCPEATAALEALESQEEEISSKWDELDASAGVQSLNIQLLAFHLAMMQSEMLGRLKDSVSGGDKSFATQMTKLASEGSRFPRELHAGPTPISVRELDQALGGNDFALDMAMASRGYGFITKRQGVGPLGAAGGILGALASVGGVLNVSRGGGSAYWSRSSYGLFNAGHGGRADGTYFSYAEDHATVRVTFPALPMCAPMTFFARAFVRATDLNDTSDDHAWSPVIPGKGHADPGMEKQYRHTLLPCDDPRYCPNTFVGGLAYNTGDHSDDNNWAQPKLFSLVQRDYVVRGPNSDPWNLSFRFHLGKQGYGAFDNNGFTTGQGIPVGTQSALATGMAYYHRRGHWNEPPNLWNPFWRATLVSADIDRQGDLRYGGGDVPATVGATAAEAFQHLIRNGYRGVH